MRQPGAGLYFVPTLPPIRMNCTAMRLLTLLLLSTFLFGFMSCGQKGPLQLPDNSKSQQQTDNKG